MPRKIRTRNKINKRNKKRSLKKMKGGDAGEYYFIYSANPTFSRYNGLLVVESADQKYNFHSGGGEISNLQKNDLNNYNKCCLKCINDFSDQNEIIRHLGSYCHTCYGDVPIS